MARPKKYFTAAEYKTARRMYKATYKAKHPTIKKERIGKPYKYFTPEIKRKCTNLKKRLAKLARQNLTDSDVYKSVLNDYEELLKSPENHPLEDRSE